MPTLEHDRLTFRFPQIEEKALFSISFKRTLRIPDSDATYPLPPSLGDFPVRHVDDYAQKLAPATATRGGVILPMWQAEAMWINFSSFGPEWDLDFPVAVKVAAGKVNAVTGEAWRAGLNRNPQDYMVAPVQPWLDGFAIAPGVIRQFVAMPLGEGYTVEGQLTGEEEWGGLQIQVTPLKAHAWERLRREHERTKRIMEDYMASARHKPTDPDADAVVAYSIPAEMGLGAGGRMRQEIHRDRFELDDWDVAASQRVFVSLLDAQAWKSVTGENAPTVPPTARDYARAGLPWFEQYGADQPPLPGGAELGKARSVAAIREEKTGAALPDSGDIDRRLLNVPRRPLQHRPTRGGKW